MTISLRDVDLVCATVKDICGIYLDESKSYLIENRLRPLLKKHHLKSFQHLVEALRNGNSELRRDFVDAITTNETLFFRDHSPFDAFEYKMLPEAFDRLQQNSMGGKVRIWSAACSTGQEAYSIAIKISEMLSSAERFRVEIVASDICEKAIGRAKDGWYADHEMDRGLPYEFREKYFTRVDNGWRIQPSLRQLVKFEQRNLMDSFVSLPKFDIVFCRNVAMYFSQADRQRLFEKMTRVVHPNGFLIIGASEYYEELGSEFQREDHCRAVVYRFSGSNVSDRCAIALR